MIRNFITLSTLALIIALALTACQAEQPVAPATEVPATEAESVPVKVVAESPVRDVIGDDQAILPTLSPDGSAIAWVKESGSISKTQVGQLCLYVFADAQNLCHDKPEKFKSFPYQLAWSPDSAYIALSENPLQLGDESDLWLFNVANRTFTNLTDDGLEGKWNAMETGSYELDYLPMWDAASGDLYFWRSIPDQTWLELFRISPEEGEAQPVRDVSEYFRGQLLPFDTEFYYMDGPSAISPNGANLAMIFRSAVRTVENADNNANNGLWLLDLTDNTIPLQQLADIDDFQVALPSWQEVPAIPEGLSWTSDSAHVVVFTLSNDNKLPISLLYDADMASGGVTAVVDFSGIGDRDTFLTSKEASFLPPRYYSPWTASLSPIGDKLLMYNDLGGESGMFFALLPPDGSLPGIVYKSQAGGMLPNVRSSRSSDGKVVMYSLLFTIAEE